MAWTVTPSVEAPVPPLPRPLRIVLGMVRFEAWLTALTAGYCASIGLLVLAVAPSKWWFAALVLGIGGATGGLAALLFRVRRGVRALASTWIRRAVAVHGMLLPPGIALYVVTAPLVNRPGTDGPFADGGQGLIGMLGVAYPTVSVIAIAILVLHRSTRSAFIPGAVRSACDQ
jgi:hypothetical protein